MRVLNNYISLQWTHSLKLMLMKITRFFFIGLLCLCAVYSCDKEKLDVVDDVCTKMDDINFMDYCYRNFDVNKDGAVSMTEASAVKEIEVTKKNISSLKGIEYFTQLTSLTCNGNQITSLDISKNTQLAYLNCISNQLSSLDISKNPLLADLYCSNNMLTSLDLSKHTALLDLQCENNSIPSLDISNTSIAFVGFYGYLSSRRCVYAQHEYMVLYLTQSQYDETLRYYGSKQAEYYFQFSNVEPIIR